MAEFNLIDERWIPCIDDNGNHLECGLREALVRAHEIREIFDCSPLVTIALHRLLLAIIYRALGGISSFKEWGETYKEGRFNANTVNQYFDKWKERFFLFHDRYPFYQMANLETNNTVTVTRLATELASGNNPTLFDHSFDNAEISFSYSEAARYLVACQAFALGFGKSGDAIINGSSEKRPYSKDAIALRGMSIWLQGKTLFHTLLINLSFYNDSSLPPWEMEDPYVNRDNDKHQGIIDILTWQSRLIRLIAENGKVEKMYFTQGRSSSKSEGYDPMKVYIKTNRGLSPLNLREGRASWRDSHAIMMARSPGSGEKRPECFNLIARAMESGLVKNSDRFVTHISGIATAPGKAGKFLLWRHERFPLTAILLTDSLLERLGTLLENAEAISENLIKRLKRILCLVLYPDSDSINWDDVKRMLRNIDPAPIYWSRLEPYFLELLNWLPEDWDMDNNCWKDDKEQMATINWRNHLLREAKSSLEESMRLLGNTARVIRASAQVDTRFTYRDFEYQSRD